MSEDIITGWHVFPNSGSAIAYFDHGRWDYVPSWIWNRKERRIGDRMEYWKTISEYECTRDGYCGGDNGRCRELECEEYKKVPKKRHDRLVELSKWHD